MDIEDIIVLKDVLVMVIYGFCGVNGVIIIMIKKGKVGKVKVNVIVNFIIVDVCNLYNMLNLE